MNERPLRFAEDEGSDPLDLGIPVGPMSEADIDGADLPGLHTLPGEGDLLQVDGLAEDDEEPPPPPDYRAAAVLPGRFKDDSKLASLASRMAQAIESGEQQKGSLPQRWRKNEAFYQNRPLRPVRLPYPGAPYFHIPFMGPRLQQRAATFVQTVLSTKAVFRIKKIGDVNPVKKVEDLLQFALNASGFEAFMNKFVESIMLKNIGVARTSFQRHPQGWSGSSHTGRFALPVCEFVSADAFSLFPANDSGVDGARWVGHKFDLMASQVKARRRAGEWLDGADLIGGDPTLAETKLNFDNDRGRELAKVTQDATEIEDRNVGLYTGVWHSDEDDDGVEEMYRVVMAVQPPTVLRIELMDEAAKGYHFSQVKHEEGVVWTESSPAMDLQGIQIGINTLVNETVWGTQFTARPAVMVQGDVGSAKGYRPGEYRTVRNLVNSAPIPSAFRGDMMMPLVQMFSQFGDSASRTSDTITGAPSTPRDATATEQGIKLQGFQTGVSDDISRATDGLVSIAREYLRLLAYHWDDWYEVYQNAVPAGLTREDLEASYTIELAGRTPEDSPQAQAQQIQSLIGLLDQVGEMVPNAAQILLELVKGFVETLNLGNKHEIVRMIEEGQMQQAQAALAEQAAMAGGVPPQGAPGSAPGAPAPLPSPLPRGAEQAGPAIALLSGMAG